MLYCNDNFIKLIEPDSCKFTSCLYEVNHTHTNYEMIFCISGSAEAIINNQSYILTSGKGVIVFPGQIHLYRNIEIGCFCVIVFKPELIPTLKNKFSFLRPKSSLFDFDKENDLSDLLERLKADYKETEEYSALLCGYINILLHIISSDMEFVSFSPEDSRLTDRITEYCFNHFRENITVAKIAKELLTNSNHISSVFNKSMNIGIPQYVEFIRLSVACDMLKNTKKSVLEISEESGFGSVRSLNRAFSEILGTTPKDFRKNLSSDYKIEIGGF